MAEILYFFTSNFELREEGDTKIEKNNDALQPGKYYIHTTAPFSINNEPWLLRAISCATGTRVKSLYDTIRSRDRRRFISGRIAAGAYLDDWTGFKAPHIFPLAHESHWTRYGYDYQEFLNNPQRPVDQLLRWHHRQAVLANMRAAGEPRFEHNFPPGSDIVGDIVHGPESNEWMEFELFTRLAAQVEVYNVSST
ncbi:hypothetical protein BJ875DRAFT_505463 [Amylocarpus encephaloides]|uniref:DUF7881 domain-containing protein n=1 Tax=Amylocarpus encephaloides TaxID=45428 RepID=A0A9P7YHT3_9HELO|nr:hypothetical protein BJ875DRAFT_505463 [Amylocarpus encephaloides]